MVTEKRLGRRHYQISRLVGGMVAAGMLSLTAGHGLAAVYTFDPSLNPSGGSDGAGTWDSSTLNWYSSSGVTTYASSATTDAVFGAGGTGGAVNLAADETANSVTTSVPGYVFTGSNTLTVGKIANTATSGTAEYDVPLNYSGALSVNPNAGSTINFNGNSMGGGTGFNVNYNSTNGTVNFTNVALSAAGSKYFRISNGLANFSGTNSYVSSGGRLELSVSGATTINVGSSTDTTATLNLGTLSGSTLGSSSYVTIGNSATNSGFNLYGTLNSGNFNDNDYRGSSASNTATFTAYAGSTANIGDLILVSNESTPGSQPSITRSAVVNVDGGNVTVGSGNALYLNQASNINGTSATLNISSGTLNAASTYGIIIGYDSGPSTGLNNSGIINLTGGTLQLGAAGIRTADAAHYYNSSGGTYLPAYAPSDTEVNFGGGTVQSVANWISSVPITLTGTNGNVTFLTSTGATAHTATLGPMSGPGGLTVAGTGTLTLVASESYQGTTSITSGTLLVDDDGTASVFPSGNTTTPTNVGALTATSAVSVTGGTFHLLYSTGTGNGGGEVSMLNPFANVSTLSTDLGGIILDLGGNVQNIAGFIVDGTNLPGGIYGSAAYFSDTSQTPSSTALSYESLFAGDGAFSSSTVAAPEPTGFALLGLAGGMLMLSRRRHARQLV